jgi:hypothetical protein
MIILWVYQPEESSVPLTYSKQSKDMLIVRLNSGAKLTCLWIALILQAPQTIFYQKRVSVAKNLVRKPKRVVQFCVSVIWTLFNGLKILAFTGNYKTLQSCPYHITTAHIRFTQYNFEFNLNLNTTSCEPQNHQDLLHGPYWRHPGNNNKVR